MPSKSSSLKIVTLLHYFSFICFSTAVTRHILAGAKGIVSKCTFGHILTGSAKCAPETGINSLPTREGITRQMDPPLACLSNISGKHHILRVETWWFSNYLFKKSNSDYRERAQLWSCITSLVLDELLSIKYFLSGQQERFTGMEKCFKYQEFSGSVKPMVPAAL